MENLLTCDRGSINVFCPGKEQIDIGYIRVKALNKKYQLEFFMNSITTLIFKSIIQGKSY